MEGPASPFFVFGALPVGVFEQGGLPQVNRGGSFNVLKLPCMPWTDQGAQNLACSGSENRKSTGLVHPKSCPFLRGSH